MHCLKYKLFIEVSDCYVLSSIVVLLHSGEVFTFGNNNHGQLGQGHTKPWCVYTFVTISYASVSMYSSNSACAFTACTLMCMHACIYVCVCVCVRVCPCAHAYIIVMDDCCHTCVLLQWRAIQSRPTRACLSDSLW